MNYFGMAFIDIYENENDRVDLYEVLFDLFDEELRVEVERELPGLMIWYRKFMNEKVNKRKLDNNFRVDVE